MRSKGRISKALALGAVAALVALSAPTLAGAIVIVGGKFGMVGIVDGQTARLNVVNTVPGDNLSPGSCMVELMFLDSMGNTLAHTRKTLMPGEAAFHDFSFDDVIGPRPTGRLQIRPEAKLLGGPDTRGLCLIVPTLEVFDNTTMQTMIFFGLTPTLVQGPAPHL
jgi:hypothetical protein